MERIYRAIPEVKILARPNEVPVGLLRVAADVKPPVTRVEFWLAEKKILVDELRLSGLRFFTARKVPTRPADPHSQAGRLLSETERWARDKFQFPKLALGRIDSLKGLVLQPEQLGSVKAVKAFTGTVDHEPMPDPQHGLSSMNQNWYPAGISDILQKDNRTVEYPARGCEPCPHQRVRDCCFWERSWPTS